MNHILNCVLCVLGSIISIDFIPKKQRDSMITKVLGKKKLSFGKKTVLEWDLAYFSLIRRKVFFEGAKLVKKSETGLSFSINAKHAEIKLRPAFSINNVISSVYVKDGYAEFSKPDDGSSFPSLPFLSSSKSHPKKPKKPVRPISLGSLEVDNAHICLNNIGNSQILCSLQSAKWPLFRLNHIFEDLITPSSCRGFVFDVPFNGVTKHRWDFPFYFPVIKHYTELRMGTPSESLLSGLPSPARSPFKMISLADDEYPIKANVEKKRRKTQADVYIHLASTKNQSVFIRAISYLLPKSYNALSSNGSFAHLTFNINHSGKTETSFCFDELKE